MRKTKEATFLRDGSHIATVLVAVGVALAGWFIGNGFVRGRTADRFVSVKGVSERDVQANMALWPLRFVSTDDNLARAQQKFDESRAAVVAFLAKHAIDATSVPRQVPPSAQRSASSGSSPRARCSS